MHGIIKQSSSSSFFFSFLFLGTHNRKLEYIVLGFDLGNQLYNDIEKKALVWQ
jgi:hypothetical protein